MPPQIRDRIKDLRRVKASDLTPNPRNWRKHPPAQQRAMAAALGEIGFADAVLAREVDGGLELIDGHLRTETVPDAELPVLVLDVTEAEADKLLATLDPLAAMATTDAAKLGDLISHLTVSSKDLQQVVDQTAAGAGIEAAPAEVAEVDRADLDTVPEDVPAITKPGEVVTLGRHTLTCGDCLEVLRSLPDASVDAVVTDPPYGIGFMGKDWDCDVPGDAFAVEALRVLKPGGHLIAFAATRTVHRLTVAIEDAGFEIRDQIAWLQWQGFPKSLDVSKAIDRMKDDREQTLQVTAWVASARDAAGITNADIDEAFGFNGMAGHWTSQRSQPAVPTLEQVPILLDLLGVDDPPEDIATLIWDLNAAKGEPGPNWWKREAAGQPYTVPNGQAVNPHFVAIAEPRSAGPRSTEYQPTAPATPDAEKWNGWGTALKPSYEPAVLARKPLEGTVADNVLAHGTGGINVDGCRIGYGDQAWPGPGEKPPPVTQGLTSGHSLSGPRSAPRVFEVPDLGRWPANIYACPKAGAERGDDNNHPTVKPIKLMRWLVRLVTPPGGTVVEPFCGSGTTLIAAEAEGVTCLAAEMEPAYCDIIRARFEEASNG